MIIIFKKLFFFNCVIKKKKVEVENTNLTTALGQLESGCGWINGKRG